MAKARLLLLDVVDAEGFKEITCDGLQDYYDALKCDCFDITSRKVGNSKVKYDMFVDDCGLLKDSPIVSALDSNLKPALVGNIIFARHDSEGNTVSLTDDDISHIKEHAITLINYDTDPISTWTVVGMVDY